MKKLIEFLAKFFRKSTDGTPTTNTTPKLNDNKESPATNATQEQPMIVDWTNGKAKISKYFTVKEALYLPKWQITHVPNAVEKNKILEMAAKMDKIREFLGVPISVHCWIRPKSVNRPGNENHKKDYNQAVKGAYASAHIVGSAVDWSCELSCDAVRDLLEPKLEEFGIRMERNPGSNWVHTDARDPGPSGERYFYP